MANFAKKIFYVTPEQYETLKNGGTVGDYTGIDSDAIYFVRPTDDHYELHWDEDTDKLQILKNGVAVDGEEGAIRIGYATFAARSGNSNKLNDKDADYYLNYDNFTGTPPAADSTIRYSKKYEAGTHSLINIRCRKQFLCIGRGTLKFGKNASTFTASVVNPMMLQLKFNATASYSYSGYTWESSFATGDVTGDYPGYDVIYMQVPSGLTLYELY